MTEAKSPKTSTINASKERSPAKRRAQSLFSQTTFNKHFYCVSIMEIIKVWERQKQKKQYLKNLRFSLLAKGNTHTLIQKKDESDLKHQNYDQTIEQPSKSLQIKNSFRVKLSPKINLKKHIAQTIIGSDEPSKQIKQPNLRLPDSNFNITTRFSIKKDIATHNFYHLRSYRQTAIASQRQACPEQDIDISPW